MKLHLHTSPLNLVTQYGDGYLDVNQTRYTENVLITPEHVAPWGRAGFDGLSAEDFAALLEYTPEVVVFGAGARLRFPHPRLTAALTKAAGPAAPARSSSSARCATATPISWRP